MSGSDLSRDESAPDWSEFDASNSCMIGVQKHGDTDYRISGGADFGFDLGSGFRSRLFEVVVMLEELVFVRSKLNSQNEQILTSSRLKSEKTNLAKNS